MTKLMVMDETLREQVVAWCRANNINPRFVPTGGANDVPRIVGDTIQFISVVDKGGREPVGGDLGYMPTAVLDPFQHHAVLRVERSAPLLVAPSAAVAAWLTRGAA